MIKQTQLLFPQSHKQQSLFLFDAWVWLPNVQSKSVIFDLECRLLFPMDTIQISCGGIIAVQIRIEKQIFPKPTLMTLFGSMFEAFI